MTEQEIYDKFSRETDIDKQDKLSGSIPQETEKLIINEINPRTLLDIGCGSGHRMFPFYQNCKIDYIGIEKFKEIIQESNYSNKILCLDIGDANFKEKFNNINRIKNFDLIVLFGVINAFIDEQLRIEAWKNISSLINNKNKLVVNTLINVHNSEINKTWYSSNESGIILNLPNIPPQYFYSEKELLNIFKNNNLKIFKYIDEDHQYIKIRYYILNK